MKHQYLPRLGGDREKQCLECTIQVGVYQIIQRENGHNVKGISELGGAQLYKSTV